MHQQQVQYTTSFHEHLCTPMNVGSILNGDSPPDNDDSITFPGQQSNAPPLHSRHSINDLLNDTPAAARGQAQSQHQNEPVRTSIANITNEVDTSEFQSSEMSNALSMASSNEDEEVELKGPVKDSAIEPNRPGKQGKGNQLVESELKRINTFKVASKKPHRYSSPPIWAQEYIPPSLNGRRDPGVALTTSVNTASSGPLSLKPLFDRSTTVSADLECLITGVIPPQSVVRTIAEWIYANFVEIPIENRQYVELELKFGTIVDQVSGHRIDIGVSTECIYTRGAESRFEMGVHEVGWNDMKSFLGELEKGYQDENRKNPSKPRQKFSVLETDDTDYFFVNAERNEMPKKIRITKDNSLNVPRYKGISKKRLSDLYIHNPSSMYDLRLSLSLEFPIDEGSVEPIMKKNKPTLTRIKRRTSYRHAPTVTQFDFTLVLLPKTIKNKLGKSITEHETSHELELEIDTNEIFKGFDKIRDGSDTIRFEELVEVYLNNARCLNNRVTKLASK